MIESEKYLLDAYLVDTKLKPMIDHLSVDVDLLVQLHRQEIEAFTGDLLGKMRAHADLTAILTICGVAFIC